MSDNAGPRSRPTRSSFAAPSRGPDPDATLVHWEGLAAGYDDAKARNDAYYQTLRDLFDAWVEPAARGRVLDVGCGTGQILAGLDPGVGVGIDASGKMIELAATQFRDRENLAFRVMDAADAADAGSFDAVISADLLEHVPDWRVIVRAIVAACREGGSIVITTPSPRWAAPLWILERLRLKMPEGPHAFVPMRLITAELEASGCTVLHAGTHALVPAGLAGAGRRISRAARRVPVLRHLGVIQLIAARRAANRDRERDASRAGGRPGGAGRDRNRAADRGHGR